MTLIIRNVRECKDGSFGYFRGITRNKCEIAVSAKKNTTVAGYGSTVLHELLHFWLHLLRLEGAKIGKKKEHRFIYDVERAVTTLMTKYWKE